VRRWFPRLLVVAFGMQFVVYAIRPLLSPRSASAT
jgi:hypothetical protein